MIIVRDVIIRLMHGWGLNLCDMEGEKMLIECDVCEGTGMIGGEVCNMCKGSGNVRNLDKIIDLSSINVDNYSCYDYYADMSKNLLGEIEKAALEQREAGLKCDAVFISFKFYSEVQKYETARFSPFIKDRLGAFIVPSIIGKYVFFHDKEDNLISFANVKWEGLTW